MKMIEPINFFEYDHNFCEASIYSVQKHPEYLNSISSLFITFIGLNALMKPHTYFLLHTLYSALAINGITSFFYHWYNNIGWGLLDRMSMILIALASTYIFLTHIPMFIKLEKWKRKKRMMNCIHLLVSGYFTVLLTIAGLHMETIFNFLFSLFLGSLIVYMFLVNKYKYLLEIPSDITILGWKGVWYIAISGFFWIFTENLCAYFPFVKYTLGHVWWHIFVSYGGYLLSLIPMYFTLREGYHSIYLRYDIFGLPYLTV